MEYELTDVKRIAAHVMLHASSISNYGLYHGKMGIVLAMASLARTTGIKFYDEYAGDLLDEIFEDITTECPFDFENGLCGIGWGILWLLKNGYMEGDPNVILSDIDLRIVEYDLGRMHDCSLRKGTAGIGFYLKSRLSCVAEDMSTPYDVAYLAGFHAVSPLLQIPHEAHFLDSISTGNFCLSEFLKMPLGIENGCAGYLLKFGSGGESA